MVLKSLSNSMRLDFTLTQMEYALAVQRRGHFAQAAADCHVSQPTLSMQIQKLEETLGAIIFDRSKKPILITPIGEALLKHFQSVISEARQIPALIAAQSSTQTQGELSLGIIPTIAPYVLPQLLPRLAADHPELRLKIQELQTSQIVRALESDEIDVGLLATPLNVPALVEFPLFFEPFYVLCGTEHPLAKKRKIRYQDLSGDDVWLLTEGHCLRAQVMDVCHLKRSKKAPRNYQFESGSLETLKSLVNSFGGYTLVPKLATSGLGENSELREFDRPIPAREVGLIYRRKQYKINLIEALGDAILSSIPKDVRALRRRDLEIMDVG